MSPCTKFERVAQDRNGGKGSLLFLSYANYTSNFSAPFFQSITESLWESGKYFHGLYKIREATHILPGRIGRESNVRLQG